MTIENMQQMDFVKEGTNLFFSKRVLDKSGIALTLRDLSQQITKETILNLDQFKYQVKAMGDQLIAFIKPDLVYEAKVVTKKLVKLATDAKPNIPKPVKQAPVQTPTVGRRGRSGQQQTDSTESNKENKKDALGNAG